MIIKTTIEKYLNIISSREGEEMDRIQKLIMVLDELALLAHSVNYSFDANDYYDPPQYDYNSYYTAVQELFPKLCYYNSNQLTDTSSISDAIDDIVDIARDLKEVLWRYENTSSDDALFHFQLLFRGHWGHHLRCLQLHLHDLCW